MKVAVKAFKTHKLSERDSDCADAFNYNVQSMRFAVADGVSQSFMPGLWAQTLVTSFCKDRYFDVKACCEHWLEKVNSLASSHWMIKNALVEQRPAASTLLSMEVREKHVELTAHGDSCLLFVSQDKPKESLFFPTIQTFDNYPDYLDSYGNHRGEAKTLSLSLQPGFFFLMTDALAEYTCQNQPEAINKFTHLTGQRDFERLIDRLRQTGKLKDDDTTLMILRFTKTKKSINGKGILCLLKKAKYIFAHDK